MKKIFLILAAAGVLSSQVAAGGGTTNAVQERETKVIVGWGLQLAAFMKEKANSKPYLSVAITGNSGKLRKIISEIGAGDVSKPTAVYELHENLTFAATRLIMAQGYKLEEIPVKIRIEIGKMLREGLPQTFTRKKAGSLGTEAVDLLKTSRTFDNPLIPVVIGSSLYFFTFEDAYPVALTIIQTADNAIWAEAQFVLDRDIITSLEEQDMDLERLQ